MKKSLLLFLLISAGGSLSAQNVSSPKKVFFKDKGESQQPLFVEEQPPSSENIAQPSSSRRVSRPAGGNTSSVSWVDLGQAPNPLTCSGRSRSNLWYDKNVNTVVFVHRLANHPTTGYVGYNRSTDAAITTFSPDTPLYTNPTDDYRGRYPSCAIYNPSGNTSVGNSYIEYTGPWTNAQGGWHGNYFGSGKLDFSSTTQNIDSINTRGFVQDAFMTKDNKYWRIAHDYDTAWSGQHFLDSIIVSLGNWNGSDYRYSFARLPAPTDTFQHSMVDMNVAFADDGMTGYIVAITHNNVFVDTVLTMKVYVTTDGGHNWCSKVLDTRRAVDPLLNNDSTLVYGTGFDLDAVVDKNKNLHIAVPIMVSGWSATNNGIVVYSTAGTWGVFDIYTTDQGTSWKGELLDKPLTFRATFGAGGTQPVPEDSRPFASRSWDGSKLFFGWFDTDTVQHAPDPTYGANWAPDMHVRAYDVDAGLWTNPMNMTQGYDPDGQCTFGNGSYYVIDNTSSYTIPCVVQILSSLAATTTATSLKYITDATIQEASFTVASNTVNVPTSPGPCYALTINVDEISSQNHTFSVSSNYPNPFHGRTTIDVILTKPSDVTVEISNTVGQVLSVVTYKDQHLGRNTMTFDGSSLAKGIYIFKVKVGDEFIARTMSVE